MQLFLRPVSGGTQVVALSPGDATLEGLERALQVSAHSTRNRIWRGTFDAAVFTVLSQRTPPPLTTRTCFWL